LKASKYATLEPKYASIIVIMAPCSHYIEKMATTLERHGVLCCKASTDKVLLTTLLSIWQLPVLENLKYNRFTPLNEMVCVSHVAS
jgi:hypothetical protein